MCALYIINVFRFVSARSLCFQVSVLTHGRLVVSQRSAAVVVFEQRSEHLGAHLRLPLQRHVGSNHLIVCVQVVTGRETEIEKEDIKALN